MLMMLALTPRIWLAVIIVVAWLVIRRLRTRQPGEPGSRDVAKDPDLFTEMQQHFDQIQDAREQAKHWSRDEVGLAVEVYLFKIPHSDDDQDLGSQLAQQPEVTATLVRDTLRNRDMQTRLQKRERDETPWVRACKLLDNAPSADNVAFVRRVLDDPSEDVRMEAWHWLAKIGSDDVIDDLIRGISQPPDDSTRGWILIGLQWADDDNRLTDHGKRGLFEPLLDNLSGYDTREVPTFLLRWNRNRAMQCFADRGLLDPAHDEFGYVAQAMANVGLALPREQLLELLQVGAESYTTSTFRAFGTMLGTLRDPADEGTLLRFLGQGGDVAEAAAAGLLSYHQIDDWSEQLQARRNDWTAEERRIDAMRWVENEVCNGGWTQYFFNSAGADWQDALVGFDEVGDTHRAELLREATAKFPTEPAADRDRRMQQLAELEADHDNAFEDLDSRYYQQRIDIDVILTRYMLAHRESLTTAWRTR